MMRTVGWMLVLCLLVFSSGCVGHRAQWAEAKRENSAYAYRAFVIKNPRSPKVSLALGRIEVIEFRHAIASKSPAKIQAAIERYPESERVAEAWTHLEALDFDIAVRTNSARNFRRFIEKYPESPRSDTALGEIAMLDLETAKSKGTLRAFEIVKRLHADRPLITSAAEEAISIIHAADAERAGALQHGE